MGDAIIQDHDIKSHDNQITATSELLASSQDIPFAENQQVCKPPHIEIDSLKIPKQQRNFHPAVESKLYKRIVH